jgi:hypothetical protein
MVTAGRSGWADSAGGWSRRDCEPHGAVNARRRDGLCQEARGNQRRTHRPVAVDGVGQAILADIQTSLQAFQHGGG